MLLNCFSSSSADIALTPEGIIFLTGGEEFISPKFIPKFDNIDIKGFGGILKELLSLSTCMRLVEVLSPFSKTKYFQECNTLRPTLMWEANVIFHSSFYK